MNTPMQISPSHVDTLKARKAHLNDLLKIVDIKIEKSTEMQKLTITAIRAEMRLIDHKLNKR